MGSPFDWSLTSSGAADLFHFRYFFNEIACSHFPCERAELLPADPKLVSKELLDENGVKVLTMAASRGKPVIDSDPLRLFLPMTINGKPYGVAVLEGGNPALYEKYTNKALFDGAKSITADFQALRARAVDPLTGLFNSVVWQEYLENSVAHEANSVLVLLEIYPRARDAAHAHSYLQRAAGALDSITGTGIPLFHIGSGLFAMLWQGVSPGDVRTLADVILYRLQRDGLDRAHMGQVWVDDQNQTEFAILMDRAWQAVVKARQRGPFAKAAFLSEKEMRHHPFHPLSPKELNHFRDCWRDRDKFSVAALKCDHDREDFAGLLGPHLKADEKLLKRQNEELYLFLPGVGPDQATALLKGLQNKVKDENELTFSVGLAAFPFGDFKRSAIPLSARKALQHTLFLGPNTITGFDAVSLNISGDVYYNEGDMNGAVREYLAGLELSPRNVNLLNSLGVAYVRLNRLKAAISCFEKALGIEKDNYMALFNLGSAWLTCNRDDLAIGFLEEALAVDDRLFDLVLQLAQLYCRAGQYRKVVELLDVDKAERERRADWEDASALRCLGEAWRNLGENRRAMKCLQQANAFNPKDSRVLSMLGELYDAEEQGDDIALSLCREAVELDDSRWDNWHRLGLVLYRQGFRQEAVAGFRKSLRLNRYNLDGLVFLEKIYRKSGKNRLANRMAEKVEKLAKKA